MVFTQKSVPELQRFSGDFLRDATFIENTIWGGQRKDSSLNA